MTDLRKAAQQALDAIHLWHWAGETHLLMAAHDALRTALEQQAEPVAWMFQHDETGRMNYVGNDGIHNPTMFLEMNPRYALVCPLYAAPPAAQPQQQAEPVCPNCKAAVLYECVACSSNNYPPQQQAEPPPEWLLIKNIIAEYGLDAIAFVADWKAAQRQWVGLTKQDMPSGEDPMFDHLYFIAGMVYADKVLKKKNT